MPTSRDVTAVRGVRFPLSAKILLWFLLNVLFLVAAAWIFARTQLRFGLDSLVAGPASERLQTMAAVLSAQLEERPPADWPAVIESNAAAYGVQLALFRNDGRRLAGKMDLPEPVRARLTELRDGRARPGPPDGSRERPPNAPRDGDARFRPPAGDPDRPPPPPRDREAGGSPPRGANPPPRDGAPPMPPALHGGFPKMMLSTDSPKLYWVLIRLPILDRQTRPPEPATLIVASETLRAGGLLFDYRPWLIGGAAVLALSLLMWLPLVRGMTRALGQMTGAAEAIAQGRFETEVADERADELGRLGTALNHMSARLREFFTGQKRFLGDIAHELCSPLARMEMALGILDQRADEKQRAYVADVREELRHMSELVHELLSFSKAGVAGKNVELKPVALAELAARVVAREGKEHGGITIDLPGALSVLAEPELLARGLGNVIRNALRYASPAQAGDASFSYRPLVTAAGQRAGPVTVSARRDGAHVILSVTDSGPGVPDAALHRLFDPFFRPESARTRETGGTGLGLAIVKSCIEACGGTVAVRNVQPSGLQVDFRLLSAP